jgi:DNA processing protein
LAVVGTGLDRVYPERNAGLAQQIARQGLLVSEYPPATAPMAHHFPQRNRLIAALSAAVLVVEASLKSGSLITAKLALEMGREVMAIPGSIHSAQARGCHALIRQGAKLVETTQDVLEELAPALRPIPTAPTPPLEATAPSALLMAMGFDPVTPEVLAQRTSLAISALQAALLNLELNGEVARLPGGFFQRLGRRN